MLKMALGRLLRVLLILEFFEIILGEDCGESICCYGSDE